MDGMLSQDEINALLSGMNSSDSSSLNSSSDDSSSNSELLTDIEKDAIGEVANISMGTSATTLYSLVNRKVNITTPVVTIATWESVVDRSEKPCVFIQIRYTSGLDGSNILVLKERDVKIIADLMMGGDGTNIDGELGELHLSAISEAMNQMMGSSATSLSSMLGKTIDISPPEASLVDLNDFRKAGEIAKFLEGSFVRISFKMQIGDLVDSSIMQLYPIEFAKSLYETFMENQAPTAKSAPPIPEMFVPPTASNGQDSLFTGGPSGQQNMEQSVNGMQDTNQMGNHRNGMEQMNQMSNQINGMGQTGQMSMNQMGNQMNNLGQMNQMGMPMNGMGTNYQVSPQNINVQQAQFHSFANDLGAMVSQENIELIKDVPLEVTVELGRTSKSIAEILDFAPGTIIELDKIAGEPIDVLVNGKFVAKGEVVVIEESFGVRVTEIMK